MNFKVGFLVVLALVLMPSWLGADNEEIVILSTDSEYGTRSGSASGSDCLDSVSKALDDYLTSPSYVRINTDITSTAWGTNTPFSFLGAALDEGAWVEFDTTILDGESIDTVKYRFEYFKENDAANPDPSLQIIVTSLPPPTTSDQDLWSYLKHTSGTVIYSANYNSIPVAPDTGDPGVIEVDVPVNSVNLTGNTYIVSRFVDDLYGITRVCGPYIARVTAMDFSLTAELASNNPCVSEQPPAENDPSECRDVLGLGSSCCDVNWWEPKLATKDYRAEVDYGNAVILPHSGQEILDETDMVIQGRDGATLFQVMRRHMTRINHDDSFFGPAWAFNYQHTFVEQADGSLLMNCFGRQDSYTPSTVPDTWEGGAGRFDVIKAVIPSLLYRLRLADGRELEFLAETNDDGKLEAHLYKIVSPNFSNVIEFSYSTQEPELLKRKLLFVEESYGRTISFEYLDPDYPDGVSHITDFSGRQVVYDYNSDGQILTVRSPIVQSTGGFGNDFLQGKTKQYTYLNHANNKMKHAVTSVIYPNQFVGGGETRLEWTYTENEAEPFFGYVETHTIGNNSVPSDLAAGGLFQYAFTVGNVNGGPNDPASFVTVTDRRNHTSLSAFNFNGQLLSEEIFTQGYRIDEPPSYFRSFVFNNDGDMLQSVDTLGATSVRTIDETAIMRTQRRNENIREDFADSRGGDQFSIQSQIIYEPIFNKPFKMIDPRGYENGNNPGDFTTFYLYDYMEDLTAAAIHFAPRLGVDSATLTAEFQRAGIDLYPGVNTDMNQDGSTSQNCGNLIKKEYPSVTLPAQASQIGLAPVQTAIELFVFNDFGQLIQYTDSEENVTVNQYFGEDDPDGDGVIDVPGGDPTAGGFLKISLKDAGSGSGRNSGQDPNPVLQLTQYQYTAQGSFPANLRAIPTAIIDPRGIKHTYLVNELDQIVVEERASDVSASPEPGLTAFQYQKVTKYDHNDNVVQVHIQNKDTLNPADDDFVVTTYEYDILDNMRKETIDDGTGNLNIINTYEYDPSLNLIRKTRGADSAPDASTEAWFYDERNILVTHTKGEGGNDFIGENAITTYNIDFNGNIIEVVDAEGDHNSIIERDGFNRQKKVIDRESNETVFTYDSASNVVQIDHIGFVEDEVQLPPGPFENLYMSLDGQDPVTLATSHFHFDERNRNYQSDQEIFHYEGKEVGQIDDGDLNPGDGLVSSITIHDRLNRVVAQVDADEDLTENRYDGLSRLLTSIDPLNNETSFSYDPNNNLLSQSDTERSNILVNDEVFVTTYSYDALNRLKTLEEPNTQITVYDYDSRDNQISATDDLGNVKEFTYDRINRLTQSQIYLSSDGQNGNSGNTDPSQGGGDGIITTTQTWDSLHRLKTQSDDRDQTTTYSYDLLDRKIRCDYEDGTAETWVYNKDSELQSHENQNGSIEAWSHDKEGRPIVMDIDNTTATPAIVGSTRKQWGYDGLDRMVLAFDNNGSKDDVLCVYTYDSLSRQIREKQAIGYNEEHKVDTWWQGQNRDVRTVYPNGRKIKNVYDDLDRQSRIREIGTSSLIARFDYVGPFRDLKIKYGNDANLSKADITDTTTIGYGYDSNRRHLRHEWLKSNFTTQITGYVNEYNQANARTQEQREHLSRGDLYDLDSAYRMRRFDRDATLSGGVLSPVPGQESTWILDGVNNWTAYTQQGTNRNPQVDSAGGVNEYSGFDGQVLVYDNNGNLIEDNDRRYSYDYSNRLVQIIEKATGQIKASYTYAADNKRVLKQDTAQGLTSRYIYKNWNCIEERDLATDNVLKQCVYRSGMDRPVQMGSFSIQQELPTEVHYFHTNSQGSIGAITDESENIVEYYEYDSYGEARILDSSFNVIASSTVGNPYMFQARRFDTESGFYYFRNRYMDPEMGRFIHREPFGNPMWFDPHNFGNGYSFVGNSPWDGSDPQGLAWDFFVDLAITAYDAAVTVKNAAEFAYESSRVAYNYYTGDRDAARQALAARNQDLAEFGQAALDTGLNAAAAAVPFVPAGLQKIRHADQKTICNVVEFSQKQLQKKFKHAKQFGIEGNYNPKNAQKFKEALQRHIGGDSTKAIKGTYKGKTVTHHLDPNTGINVIEDASGNFVSGWRLGKEQLEHVIKSGALK